MKFLYLLLLFSFGVLSAQGQTQELFDAAHGNAVEKIVQLLESGMPVNTRDPEGATALHYAAAGGSIAVAKELIKRGASLDAQRHDGATPLHYAAFCGHAKMIELLCDAGARIDNQHACTKDVEIVTLLTKKRAERIQSKPCYIITLPSADHYTGPDEESDGESDDDFSNPAFFQETSIQTLQASAQEIKKEQNPWEALPFYLDHEAAAYLEPINVDLSTDAHLNELLTRIKKESFGASTKESVKEAQERLRCVILANRLKSISRTRNYIPTAQIVQQPEDAIIMTFHLVPQWVEWIDKTSPMNKRRVPPERVQKFFRAWKHWEKKQGIVRSSEHSMARLFRCHFEKDLLKKYKRTIVPFHSLREILAKSPAALSYAQQFAPLTPDTYLFLFDDDFGPLRRSMGLFSVYDNLVFGEKMAGNPAPSIMSSGYEFPPESIESIARVGNEMDMAVRIATASVIPHAVCYSEANCGFRIPQPIRPNGPLLRTSFKTTDNGKSQTETRAFIRELYENKEASPATTKFIADAPLYTTPSKEIKEHSPKIPHGSKDGKITEWGTDAIQFLRTFSQSHLETRDWAWGVVNALELQKSFKPESFGLDAQTTKPFPQPNSKGKRFLIGISAASRMAAAYNPINAHILDSLQKKSAAEFRITLYALLKNYATNFPRAFPPGKITTGKSLYNSYLKQAQTVDLAGLRAVMVGIFGPTEALRVEEAAKRAGQAIVHGILSKFDFGVNEATPLTAPLIHEPGLGIDMGYDYTDDDIAHILQRYIQAVYQDVVIIQHQDIAQYTLQINKHIFIAPARKPEEIAHYLLNHLNIQKLPAGIQHIVVPLHIQENHWITLIITQDTTGPVPALHIMTIGTRKEDLSESLHKHLTEFFQTHHAGCSIKTTHLTKRVQLDAHSCGPLMIENIKESIQEIQTTGALITPPQPILMLPQLVWAIRKNHQFPSQPPAATKLEPGVVVLQAPLHQTQMAESAAAATLIPSAQKACTSARVASALKALLLPKKGSVLSKVTQDRLSSFFTANAPIGRSRSLPKRDIGSLLAAPPASDQRLAAWQRALWKKMSETSLSDAGKQLELQEADFSSIAQAAPQKDGLTPYGGVTHLMQSKATLLQFLELLGYFNLVS